MPRATLEYRPTLDDLFGPDLEAEMRALGDLAVSLIKDLGRIIDRAESKAALVDLARSNARNSGRPYAGVELPLAGVPTPCVAEDPDR